MNRQGNFFIFIGILFLCKYSNIAFVSLKMSDRQDGDKVNAKKKNQSSRISLAG